MSAQGPREGPPIGRFNDPNLPVATATGVCSGLVVHTVVAALGLGVLVRASESLYLVLQFAGAAYVAYLGLQLPRTPQGPLAITGRAPKRPARMFFDGALSNLCNPKIIILYLAFLPQFVAPGAGHAGLSLFVLGLVFAVLAWMVKAPLGFGAAALAHWLRSHPRSLAWLFRVSGAVLLGLGLQHTGAHPVRPHMLSFNASHSHAVLSFVTSGHVVVFDAATRTPVACLRASPGAGGARQAHAATSAPDDSYILVANQNGKLLERIDADFATQTFTLNPLATLDLAACLTPYGNRCEDVVIRPDNAPIVAPVDSSSALGFIALRGGGLLVVDPKATPMQVIGEYDSNTVRGNGFAGAQAAGTMFVNSGGGTASNLHRFDVYAFPLTGYSITNQPNTPRPRPCTPTRAPSATHMAWW